VNAADLAIVAALIFGWGTLSARLERFDVTAPVIFVLAGLLLTHGPLAVLHVARSNELVKGLAEFTLARVLFSDASRVGLHELRADAGLYVRLLGVALPLTIGLGTVLALAPAGDGIWLALLVGAALAPTDAALGAGMMANPVVPARIRRLINVESGLNDGIATPFVSVALAGAATGGHLAGHGPAAAVAELAVGLAAGVAAGGVGGLLVNAARRRGWAADGFAGAAVLGLAVCAYASAVAIDGNGVHRRLRRRPRVRHHRRPARRTAGAVRRGNGRADVLAALAGLRRCGTGARDEDPDLADGPVCVPQPHCRPDGAGRDGAPWRAARLGDGPPGGLVRPAGPGLGGVRAARPGGTGQPHRGSCRRGYHHHRFAQRGGTRCHSRTAG
jgi:hypothetical protein